MSIQSFASVSDIKKAPMNVINRAASTGQPVTILNSNRPVGVVMDAAQFDALTTTIHNAYAAMDALNERIYRDQVAQRIRDDNGKRVATEEIFGENWRDGLDEVADEWE